MSRGSSDAVGAETEGVLARVGGVRVGVDVGSTSGAGTHEAISSAKQRPTTHRLPEPVRPSEVAKRLQMCPDLLVQVGLLAATAVDPFERLDALAGDVGSGPRLGR